MYTHMSGIAVTELIPLDPRQRREWVKYQLALHGYTLGRLAREVGVAPGTLIGALWKPYPKMEAIIAAKLGAHPKQIWPERYTSDGQSNRPRGRARRVKVHKHASKVISPDGHQGNGKQQEAAQT